MSNATLVLWCNAASNSLIAGWQSNANAPKPQLKQGDTVEVKIHWINAPGDGTYKEVQFPPSASITMALGLVGEAPVGGSFKINYSGEETALLASSATAVQVQTALNALPSITAEGGVTVSKNKSTFRVVWNNEDTSNELLSVNVDSLTPSCFASVNLLREGTEFVSKIFLVNIEQSPIAASTNFVTSPSLTTSITNVLNNTWRFNFSQTPKSGSYRIGVVVGSTTYYTSAIAWNATALEVQNALNDLVKSTSTKRFSVSATDNYSLDITTPVGVFILSNDTAGSVSSLIVDSAVVGWSSASGTISLNTVQVEEFLAGEESRDCTLEVEVVIDGNRQTIAHTDATIINDLITDTAFNLVSLGDVMPVDSVVRYDTSQTLTEGQKLMARQNIGATDGDSLDDMQAEINVVESRIDSIEYSVLTASQKDAVDGAETPSSSNVFVTQSVLTTGLATKAATVHTHTASAISDSTEVGRALLTSPTVGNQRFLLGLGTMSVQPVESFLSVTSAAITYSPINSPTFTGTVTIPAGASISGYLTTAAANTAYLIKSSNLGDLPNVATARTNLGLGTAATMNASSFVTNIYAGAMNQYVGNTSTPTFAGVQFADSSSQTTALTNSAASRNAIGLGTANATEFLSTEVGTGSTKTKISSVGVTFPDGTIQTTAGAIEPSSTIQVATNASGTTSVTLGNTGYPNATGGGYGMLAFTTDTEGGAIGGFFLNQYTAYDNTGIVSVYSDPNNTSQTAEAGFSLLSNPTSLSGELTLKNGETGEQLVVTPQGVTFPDGTTQVSAYSLSFAPKIFTPPVPVKIYDIGDGTAIDTGYVTTSNGTYSSRPSLTGYIQPLWQDAEPNPDPPPPSPAYSEFAAVSYFDVKSYNSDELAPSGVGDGFYVSLQRPWFIDFEFLVIPASYTGNDFEIKFGAFIWNEDDNIIEDTLFYVGYSKSSYPSAGTVFYKLLGTEGDGIEYAGGSNSGRVRITYSPTQGLKLFRSNGRQAAPKTLVEQTPGPAGSTFPPIPTQTGIPRKILRWGFYGIAAKSPLQEPVPQTDPITVLPAAGFQVREVQFAYLD